MDTDQLPPLAPKPRRDALAICGGGYAGLFAAEFLARLEKRTHAKAAVLFDLVGGTSIGGILALGLAKGLSAAVLSKLLEDIGSDLFGRPALPLLKPKHDPAALRTKLEEVFGDGTLAQLPHPVLVPAVDLTAGETVVFSNAADAPSRTTPVVDVALATAAAPLFLPPFGADHRLFADGGLAANSPEALVASEAIHRRRWPRGRTSLLVVGSTQTCARVPGHQVGQRWGGVAWGKGLRLVGVTMRAQMSLARRLAIETVGADAHHVADVELSAAEEKVISLDKATPAATAALKTLAANAFTRFEREDARYLATLVARATPSPR